MRKLRVFESISIDGYFTDTSGDIGWSHAAREDADFSEWVSGNASKGSALSFRWRSAVDARSSRSMRNYG
jgi:hypothetical protein